MHFNNTKSNAVKAHLKSPSLKLVGTDGNAYSLMGAATSHNRKHRLYSAEDMKTIMDECTSGDYDHLLATLMYFFNVK